MRLHNSTRDWMTGAFVDGTDFATHLYRKVLKTNPNIVQREASKMILEMFAYGPALRSGERECRNRYPVSAMHQSKWMTNISFQ